MKPNSVSSIVLIGAGNVGTQLGKRLHEQQLPVAQIFSRQSKKAKTLADEIESDWTSDLATIQTDASLYILAVCDNAIADVAARLEATIDPQSLVVHTSGATPGSILRPFFNRHGVLYPLQSLSIDQEPNWSTIPVCLYANQPEDRELLEELANRISDFVYYLNDQQRESVHVAAVFANNFPNFLFSVANEILNKSDLPFDLIRPLILETASKVQNALPQSMQTGPAIRGDDQTLDRHREYLKHSPQWSEIYELLTDQIRKQQ